MRSSIKSLFSVADGKDTSAAQEALKSTVSTIAKTASKGVIHKKTASRKISRLTKRVNTALQKG
jgi:small subunit ribosomal protein S20